ncbi:MAG: DUF4290 domain-containing protein [Bacteroides sp.]|nr:DUF4290 domain-containing protein [Bacteroides sp.]MBD5365110.1 DUF4290 domain-containing protein [Bacteroides sp.]MBD5373616.1 DUF4290 domain-containing protein [Bacteroides sp.]MDE6033992.1 DUF4290 domain-containing protein [Muribaculaceae bacterium]MDE6262009.1 DUF4290 domain-containing protein [Muribaculaceae bacterium]
MLQYNTKQEPLRMPEYGRHVQQMVDHCLTIDDRDERNLYARGIIDTICRLNPQQRTSPEWRAKLWDHLAIMSNFQLDIDYPEGCSITPEELNLRPEPMALPPRGMMRRVYGNNIDQMIDAAIAMAPDDPDREEFIILLANHMKKLMMTENPENATDARIFKDLAEMSGGHLRLSTQTTKLREFEILEAPVSKKKKRKR